MKEDEGYTPPPTLLLLLLLLHSSTYSHALSNVDGFVVP